MSMACKKCGEDLDILSTSSEYDGIRRDRYCSWCDTKYMCTAAMLVEIESERPDYYHIIGRQQIEIENLKDQIKKLTGE